MDIEAVNWAYSKLIAFCLETSTNINTVMMMDRLKLIILTADTSENQTDYEEPPLWRVESDGLENKRTSLAVLLDANTALNLFY
jgi:hypothetical protein